MNHMISSEISLYIALALAGTCGYTVVQWASVLLCPKRKPVFTAKADKLKADMLDTEDVKPAASAVGSKARSRARAGSTKASLDCATSALVPQARDSSKHELCVEATVEVVPERKDVQPTCASSMESERVARLLAKKAERKARKAQERASQAGDIAKMDTAVHEHGMDCQSVSETPPVPDAARLESQDVLSEKALSQDAREVDVSVAVKSALRAEDSQENQEVSSKQDASSCESQLLNGTILCHDMTIAELSTSDETFACQGHPEETEDDSLDEGVAGGFDMEEHTASQPSHALHFQSRHGGPETAVWTRDDEFFGLYHPVPYDDAWMAPLDGVIRSRQEAERVYTEVMAGMCTGAGVAPVPDTLYEVVSCDGTQKLYSDGEQLFMLACAGVSTEMGFSPSQVLHPVVDVHDPLHMDFASDHQNGLTPHAISNEPQVPIQSGAIWDACW